MPLVEASVQGVPPKRFMYDTGGTSLSLSMEAAAETGLRAVSTGLGQAGGQTFTMYFGVLDSFRLGDIEPRNFPVHWADVDRPTQLGDPQPAGVIGTHIFYHFLTTLDYANQALHLAALISPACVVLPGGPRVRGSTEGRRALTLPDVENVVPAPFLRQRRPRRAV